MKKNKIIKIYDNINLIKLLKYIKKENIANVNANP
jgi:hypothetical protein